MQISVHPTAIARIMYVWGENCLAGLRQYQNWLCLASQILDNWRMMKTTSWEMAGHGGGWPEFLLLVTLGANMGRILCRNIGPGALAFCQLLHHGCHFGDVHPDLFLTVPLPDSHVCCGINCYSKWNTNLICPCIPPPNGYSCQKSDKKSLHVCILRYHVICSKWRPSSISI